MSPVTIQNHAWHVWCHVAKALEAAATAGGHTADTLATATGLHMQTIHRTLRRQDRLSLETTISLSLAMGLDPAALIAAAIAAVPEPVNAV